MRVLITGAAGFLGSHLVEFFLKKNFSICGIDNFLTGERKNIKDYERYPNFTFYEGNVTELEIKENFTHILHFASPASPRDYYRYPFETMKVNTIGTWKLLEKAKIDNSVFIFASTSEVYGDPLQHPQKETYLGNVNCTGPRSIYDESKRFGESLCSLYFRQYDMDVRILRIFNTYGPRMRKDDGRVIPNFITQALENKKLTIYGNGEQTRSFCYVDDMVKGIFLSVIKEHLQGEVINLGAPHEFTIKELAQIISELTDKELEIEYLPLPKDDPKRRCPCIEKAKKLLGWKPETPLKEGLLKTIEYFRISGSCDKK